MQAQVHVIMSRHVAHVCVDRNVRLARLVFMRTEARPDAPVRQPERAKLCLCISVSGRAWRRGGGLCPRHPGMYHIDPSSAVLVSVRVLLTAAGAVSLCGSLLDDRIDMNMAQTGRLRMRVCKPPVDGVLPSCRPWARSHLISQEPFAARVRDLCATPGVYRLS
jgi:hypothetical protein